jgi:hypothetical protein
MKILGLDERQRSIPTSAGTVANVSGSLPKGKLRLRLTPEQPLSRSFGELVA